MIRILFLIVLLAALVSTVSSCSDVPMGPWGGPAYVLEPSKIGTGEQAIVPRNDCDYANGEPSDYRSRHR
jgi:hypothetical protein